MKRLITLSIAFVILIMLSGCAAQNASVPMNYRWSNIEDSQLSSVQAGEQFYFNIVVDDGMIKDGKPMQYTFGNILQRVIYHYWYHLGEIMAIRQKLGHEKLPIFVGNIDTRAPYRPEASDKEKQD